MGRVTKDDLIEIAEKFSQELREICDKAKGEGDPLPGTEALLDEWDVAYWNFNNEIPFPYSKVQPEPETPKKLSSIIL